MINTITSRYKVRKNIKLFFVSIALAIFITSLLQDKVLDYLFFTFFLFFIALAIHVFASDRKLILRNDTIYLVSHNIIDGRKEVSIPINNIMKVRYLKRKYIIFGGRNYMADADAQTLYHGNRIVLYLKDGSLQTIQQFGRKNDFKEMSTRIKNLLKVSEE